ncbi:MAG TPA: carboxypeptidase regulatory-like domain-containing protein [Longimicrobiaceae bacterium]|nr:carboxypeptidase regulatory-like domain-containing protein [Longimicrobiaceae bacterium]
MRILLALFLAASTLLAAAGGASAQDDRARLRVTVTDTLGQPVRDAQVTVNGAGAPARSDSTGTALVAGIPLGTRMVTVWRLGFGEERAVLQFPSANTFRLNVVLTPGAIALDSLLVEGERRVRQLEHNGFYQRRRMGLGSFVNAEQMEVIARTSPDLRRAFFNMPGFQVVPGRFGSAFTLLSNRGVDLTGSPCQPAVVVDGRRSDMTELVSILPQQVEAIEAYPGAAGAPPEYAFGQSVCGMVLVWLKK